MVKKDMEHYIISAWFLNRTLKNADEKQKKTRVPKVAQKFTL